MTEHEPVEERPPEAPPPPRGSALVAWGVIVLVVVTVVTWQRWRTEQAARLGQDRRLKSNVIELQGRYLVGVKELLGHGDQLVKQAKEFDRGAYRQRLRFVVLAGELASPQEAVARLVGLGAPPKGDDQKATAIDEQLRVILLRLYRRYAANQFDPHQVLSDRERETLRSELGWFGELALTPPQIPDEAARQQVIAPAQRVAVGLFAGVFGGLGLGCFGFIGLVVLLVLLANRTVRRGFFTGLPYGAVYAETFALWLVLFVGLLWAGPWLPARHSPLLQSSLLALFSLGALGWPVWRGIPWGQVRRDIGLHGGRRPFLEVLSGLATYAMSLPLLAVGFLVMLLILALAHRGGGLFEDNSPAHPLVGLVGNDWWVRMQILLAAAVVAPIVEETMFRGVFYRHLREATRTWGVALSVLGSGLVSGFLFAVVHPQGLVAVPVLMGLAFGFALGREWRGSLVACMVAHGVHNGLLTLFFFLALGK